MNCFFAVAFLAAAPGAVVITPVANIYSAPTEESDVVSQAIFGSSVGLLEEKEGWAKVRTADEYSGWMALASLRRLRENETPYASTGTAAQVDALFANLYHEPDVTKHQPLLTVPFETRLEVVSQPENEDHRWLEARLPDGQQAWIQRGDITLDPKPLSVDAATDLARRFLGLPYLWGGTSSFGFDCSAFTQMLYRRQGVGIPRDADQQARWEGFAPVNRYELRPGDLVFFGKSADKITHTGMYIGNGEFIHATAYKRPAVQISRLAEPHWSELLVACRRLK